MWNIWVNMEERRRTAKASSEIDGTKTRIERKKRDCNKRKKTAQKKGDGRKEWKWGNVTVFENEIGTRRRSRLESNQEVKIPKKNVNSESKKGRKAQEKQQRRRTRRSSAKKGFLQLPNEEEVEKKRKIY